eukprot:406443_1
MDTSSTNIPNNTTHCHRYHLHHVPHHGQDQQWRKRVTCKHYMKEGCKRGTECWYKHELVSNESIFANIIYGIRGMENKMDTQSKRDEMILKKLDAITSSMSAITAIQSEQNNQLASLKDSIEQNQQKLNQLVSSTAVHTNRLNTMTQKVDKLVKSNKQQMESIEKDMMEKSVKMQSMNRTLCDVQQYLSSTPMESNIAKNKATHSPNINETLTFDTSSFGPVQGFNIDGTQSFKFDTSSYESNTEVMDKIEPSLANNKMKKDLMLNDVASDDIGTVPPPNYAESTSMQTETQPITSPTTVPTDKPSISPTTTVTTSTLTALQSRADKHKLNGNKYFKESKYEDALNEYIKAEELDPKDAVYVSNQSAALLKMKRWDECIARCHYIINMKPPPGNVLLYKIYKRLGKVSEAQNDTAGMIMNFENALLQRNDTELKDKIYQHQHPELRMSTSF